MGSRVTWSPAKSCEREEGDGITMDCLGALGRSKVSLPCIAWSRMLDDGIPAACEADMGAALTHAVVQFCSTGRASSRTRSRKRPGSA